MHKNARLFLATSKRATFARTIIQNKGLGALFNGIYGSTPAGNIDHKPELIAHIMTENGLVADRCVMVGGRKFDITGAHANRMSAIGVLWGYGKRDELEQSKDLSGLYLTLLRKPRLWSAKGPIPIKTAI
ncbi:HAD-hyrolase-like [Rhizobium mongolense subsp. loessense]|uniref:HAD-hyrolase-like n=2 Tax=Rhizobium mongolense TaxID=57676 RepID=A0A1G4R2B6_9HYPH|nr:HAD-hyrolase-like [Rhizobium mongolense subsp. loessense]